MASCSAEGGCPTDYLAVAISLLSLITLLARATAPFLIHKFPLPRGSAFWLPAVQVFASINILASIAIPGRYLKHGRKHWWQSCYFWRVWFEGPAGFGLLLCCRIFQVFQLYFIFVKRRLPPIRSYIFLPLILVPWIAAAALVHKKKLVNPRCHLEIQSMIPIMCLHIFYIAVLVAFTWAIRHIEFRFHELTDLWRGVLVSAAAIGLFVISYILNGIHEEIHGLQVSSRFFTLVMASILILAFFSVSSSQPLISQMSLKRPEVPKFDNMGHALGIPDSGLLSLDESCRVINPSEPLDVLLQNRRFRQSFMAFAESCFAVECVCFFDEVHELSKIHPDDLVRRIYMVRHIIERYIVAGAAMEVNISHRSRQEIMGTHDLTHPNLFDNALHEVIQLMKMNLAKDYWSSIYFAKLKDETVGSTSNELDRLTGCNFSPSLSSDDPFHQELSSSCFSCSRRNSDANAAPECRALDIMARWFLILALVFALAISTETAAESPAPSAGGGSGGVGDLAPSAVAVEAPVGAPVPSAAADSPSKADAAAPSSAADAVTVSAVAGVAAVAGFLF